MIDLSHLAIRYRLGLLDTESLVRLADQLLEEGRDTTSVIELSLLESPIMAEAAHFLKRFAWKMV